jgi:hypothetical protein
LAELPPGGEKALNASMQQAIQSDVEPSVESHGSQKVNMEPPPGGQKALKASMQQAIKSDVEPPARR